MSPLLFSSSLSKISPLIGWVKTELFWKICAWFRMKVRILSEKSDFWVEKKPFLWIKGSNLKSEGQNKKWNLQKKVNFEFKVTIIGTNLKIPVWLWGPSVHGYVPSADVCSYDNIENWSWLRQKIWFEACWCALSSSCSPSLPLSFDPIKSEGERGDSHVTHSSPPPPPHVLSRSVFEKLWSRRRGVVSIGPLKHADHGCIVNTPPPHRRIDQLGSERWGGGRFPAAVWLTADMKHQIKTSLDVQTLSLILCPQLSHQCWYGGHEVLGNPVHHLRGSEGLFLLIFLPFTQKTY